MAFTRTSSLLRGLLAPLSRVSATSGRGRDMSTGILNITKDEKTGVAIFDMNRPPINSMNLEMLTEFYVGLEKLEDDKSCRGAILSTKNPHVFTAGLDLMEMYNPKEDRLREFLGTLQNLFLKLYGSRLITISAISGESPAGGCIFSLACDHRVMADGKYSIGLNEALLGIVVPFWFHAAMRNTIGQRETERAIQLGKLYKSQEALAVGLVDQVVPKDQIMEAAKAEMGKWLKLPDHARVITKRNLRQPLIQEMTNRNAETLDAFVSAIMKKPIQKGIGMYLESMKK